MGGRDPGSGSGGERSRAPSNCAPCRVAGRARIVTAAFEWLAYERLTERMGRMNGASFDRCRFGLRIVLGAILLGGAIDCGGGDMATSPKVPQPAMRSEELEHESCGGQRSEVLDTNGDGKPDITKYYDGSGHEQCRVADLNSDGKADLYEYFDASGQIRRREFCYDDSGSVNAIEYYEQGKLARREYDISGRHRVDTWDWFDPSAQVDAKTGRPAHPTRRERDSKGDGHVDQWWSWDGDHLTIAFDRDGSGRPDPATVLVFGGDAGAPEPPSANPAAAGGGAPGGGSATIPAAGARNDGGAP